MPSSGSVTNTCRLVGIIGSAPTSPAQAPAALTSTSAESTPAAVRSSSRSPSRLKPSSGVRQRTSWPSR